MISTGGDVLGGATVSEVDHGEAVAHSARGVAAVPRIAEAELTVIIPSPALDGVVVEERARVISTDGDVNSSAERRGARRAR